MLHVNERYVDETRDEKGNVVDYQYKYPENFNFAYDVVDAIAEAEPGRRAMIWCNPCGEEHVFTYGDLKRYSDKTANMLASARAIWSWWCSNATINSGLLSLRCINLAPSLYPPLFCSPSMILSTASIPPQSRRSFAPGRATWPRILTNPRRNVRRCKPSSWSTASVTAGRIL